MKKDEFAPKRGSSPVLVLLHHLEPLERLQHAAGDALGAAAEVAGHHAVALPPAVDLGHGAHAGAAAQVQVPGGGG